jgi:hypothetical protein
MTAKIFHKPLKGLMLVLIFATENFVYSGENSNSFKDHFPDEKSARQISGELMGSNHLHLSGTLRVDRTDEQRRGDWDLPLDFTLMPCWSSPQK